MDNYLLVVEGKKDEKNVFQYILERYGFNVVRIEEKIDVDNSLDFTKINMSDEKNNVVIIEGPRNRIHDFLKYYDEHTDSIEKMFHYSSDFFQGIFLIYDVDHNDCDDIDIMFNKFQDESSGLLLLNSPCLEVIGDQDYNRVLEVEHLTEYKAILNTYHEAEHKTNTLNFIKENFNSLILHFLEKNRNDFNEKNIMEHPALVKKKINEMNIRCNDKDNQYVFYRYFTTVVYVMIAYISKLTIEIDNYDKVYNYFKN